MADPITIGLGVAAIGSSILGGLSAKSKAKEAARQQARLTRRMRDEEIRQRQRQADYEQGAGRALLAASNVQMSGSGQRYLNVLDMENMREIAAAKAAAKLEGRAIRAGAAGAGASFFAQAAGDAIGLAAQLYANRTVNPPMTAIDGQTGATIAPPSIGDPQYQRTYVDTGAGVQA